MSTQKLSAGVAHAMPPDLKKALLGDTKAMGLWESLTPLARNEWICWVEAVKTAETRQDHVRRTVTELKEGMRRPCCWIGCIHRTDKPMSRSQKFILGKRNRK
ncbi:MAG: YdeI/OmpD-associated family protein [Candidatus Kerfeldbacteria bacterium]|nr:YdeI/OmpD-associated family protein [Candidatus Kerfeldbacteria bacterium]